MSAPRSPQEPTVPPLSTPEEAEPAPATDEAGGSAGRKDAERAVAAPAEAAPAEQAPAETGPVHRVVDVADPSRVRRAPRYGRFALAGLLLAMAVSFGLTFVPGAEDGLTRRNLFFLLLLALGSLGIVLGLLVALWTDRRSLRRRR